MAKKRRNRIGPPKGAVVLYKESPQNKWIHQWWPPKGSAAFFSMGSDADFKRAHPIGYGFLVALGITALLTPFLAYALYTGIALSAASGWLILGWVGAFIIGIGLFNFVAIIIKQYLGHWVSILCFLIGGILVAVSLHLL
jgi:hypothetical protein